MKSRTSLILAIIAAWILLVAAILIASTYINVSGLKDLEKKAAEEDTNRVVRILDANFDSIYSLNLDAAYWDDTYAYVQKKNKDFIDKNFSEDFFKDNKVNYVIITNKEGEVVWSKGFDLTKKAEKEVPVPADLLDYFKKNAMSLLKHKEDYNNLEAASADGIGSFLKSADGTDVYFALNYIEDTEASKAPLGTLVYAKKVTPDVLENLSKVFKYKISLIPVDEFTKNPGNKEIYDSIATNKAVYSEPQNDDVMDSYRSLQDVNKNAIGVVRVDLPRTLYNQARQSTFWNRLLLLAFSFVVVGLLSSLIYLFFKRQELLTRSFERFVPRQLIDLLKKKDIIEVDLGNSSLRDISVLFMDIRNFTSISEKLTPQQNFDFINTILKDVAPMVERNAGFIDKYIGDAIMALFPAENTNADDAVRAGMMILDELDKLNYTGKLNIQAPVKIGIGINTGKSVLGIIGASGRLEGTVISDSINTASRIQSLTKTYEQSLLISEETYKAMKHPEYYTITHVEDVLVKGKETKVSIYKVEKRR